MRCSGVRLVCAVALGALTSAASAGVLLAKVGDIEPANNTVAGATTIALGEQGRAIVFRGTLTSNDSDLYKVVLGNNGQVTFITTPISNDPLNPYSSPDTIVEILDAGGTSLDFDDDAGAGTGSQLGSCARYDSLTPNDTVIFKVRGLSSITTGEYLVTIIETFGANTDWTESASNETPGTADVLDLRLAGAMHGKGTLTSGTDKDIFAIDMRRGEGLVFVVTPQMTPWVDPDTIATIIDQDGVTVLELNDDDSADAIIPNVISRGSLIRFRAPATGRYYAQVSGFSGATGEYRASFALIPADDASCAGDADENGVVNFADITNVLANFNATCP